MYILNKAQSDCLPSKCLKRPNWFIWIHNHLITCIHLIYLHIWTLWWWCRPQQCHSCSPGLAQPQMWPAENSHFINSKKNAHIHTNGKRKHWTLKKEEDHFDFLDHEQAETKLTKDSTEQKMKMIIFKVNLLSLQMLTCYRKALGAPVRKSAL